MTNEEILELSFAAQPNSVVGRLCRHALGLQKALDKERECSKNLNAICKELDAQNVKLNTAVNSTMSYSS